MKREVHRERNIPAFSISVDDLEVLWMRIVALFNSRNTIHGLISIKLPSEKLEFNNIKELKQYPELKGSIRNFSLWLHQENKHISIDFYSFSPQAVVRASGQTESWCAGSVEAVYSFLQSYKLWYHWFVSAPIGWVLALLINLPIIGASIIASTIPKGTTIDKSAYFGWAIGWLVTVFALAFLYFFRGNLFPAHVLRVTEEEGFIRRHSAELSLIIALLSLVLTVIGLFFRR